MKEANTYEITLRNLGVDKAVIVRATNTRECHCLNHKKDCSKATDAVAVVQLHPGASVLASCTKTDDLSKDIQVEAIPETAAEAHVQRAELPATDKLLESYTPPNVVVGACIGPEGYKNVFRRQAPQTASLLYSGKLDTPLNAIIYWQFLDSTGGARTLTTAPVDLWKDCPAGASSCTTRVDLGDQDPPLDAATKPFSGVFIRLANRKSDIVRIVTITRGSGGCGEGGDYAVTIPTLLITTYR
jgi:hypothetical protein